MGFLKSYVENYVEAMTESKEMFDNSVEHFKNGNIGGGIESLAMSGFNTLGNAITYGGSHALGEYLADKDSDDKNFVESKLEDMAKGRAENQVREENLEKIAHGEKGYQYDDDFNMISSIDGSDLTAEEQNSALKSANLIGGAQVVSDALTIATAATGLNAVTTMAGAARTAATETAVKVSAEQAFKEATSKGAEKVAETAAEKTAEKVAKKTAENALKKSIMKEVYETSIDGGMKAVVEGAVSPAKVAKAGMKAGVSEVKKHLGKAAVAGVVTASTVQATGSRVDDIVEDVDKYGVGGAVASEVARQTGSLTKDAANVASEVLGGGVKVLKSKLEGYDHIKKFFNTCEAMYYASTKCLGSSTIGAYTAAICKSAVLHVEKFINRDKGKVLSLRDILKQIQSNSQYSDKGFVDTYRDKVVALDKEDGFSSENRWTVRNQKLDELAVSENEQAGVEAVPAVG